MSDPLWTLAGVILGIVAVGGVILWWVDRNFKPMG